MNGAFPVDREAVETVLPWARRLPEGGQRAMLREAVDRIVKLARTGADEEGLARDLVVCLAAWRSTAEVCGSPEGVDPPPPPGFGPAEEAEEKVPAARLIERLMERVRLEREWRREL